MPTLNQYHQILSYFNGDPSAINDPKSPFNTGFGQLHAFLHNPADPQDWPKHMIKYRSVVDKIYNAIFDKYGPQSGQIINSLKAASLTSYYTPAPIIEAIYKNIDFSKIETVLEPSAGTGNFIDALPTNLKITAVEPDLIAYEILQQKYPNMTTHNCGLQEAKLKKYDLVISNIPFGNISVFDQSFYDSKNPVKIQSTTRIHNYFFTKAIDLVNDHGHIAFITSSSFLDNHSKANIALRSYITQHCSLVAAVRLPQEIFKASGTLPTTDLIILKKSHHAKSNPADQLFIKSSTINHEQVEISVNHYYQHHRDYMIGALHTKGQYGQKQAALSSQQSLETIADELFETLEVQKDTFSEIETSIKDKAPVNTPKSKTVNNNSIRLELLPNRLEPGSLFSYKNIVGIIQQDENGYYLQPLKKHQDLPRVTALVHIKQLYLSLIDAERTNHELTEECRSTLREHYNLFVFQHGYLNSPQNRNFITLDNKPYLFYALEKRDGKDYTSATILSQRINNKTLIAPTPQTLSDAIIQSLNQHNYIKWDLICKLMDKSKSALLNEGIKKDIMYLDFIEGQWYPVTKDVIISGDMYRKKDAFNNHFPNEFKHLLDTHLEIINAHMPSPVPIQLIDVNLGERWIEKELFEEFISNIFEVPAKLSFSISQDKFEISLKEHSSKSTNDFTVHCKNGRKKNGVSLMANAFNGVTPNITYSVKDGNTEVTYTDVDAIRLCEEKIEYFNEQFYEWLPKHERWAEHIEHKYNRLFNNISSRYYNGSHLDLSDVKYFKPHEHQQNGLWRILQQQGGIADHKVGSGKSLLMAMSAHYLKKLGLVQKPLIIGLKANLQSVYKEYKKAFPNDKILHPEERDFSPHNRAILFQRMMNEPWDCVILTHEQFTKIPQPYNTVKEIIDEEIHAMELDLNDSDVQLSRRERKGLETKIQNLAARIQAMENAIKKDPNLVDFEQLGFDHLFVDESQQFKNLPYTTRHSQVSGLGNPLGSQRALNLLFACRHIQKMHGYQDKGITFLSGTVISNSLVELYLLFKYLRPNELKRLCINSFDAWAKVYAKKSSEFEFGVTNEIKRKERFRNFIKVPELAKFYTQITDVVNDKNFKVEKPIPVNKIVPISPTSSQLIYMEKLVKFAKTKNGEHIGMHLTATQEQAYMLLATNLAKKMSLDMRLIDPTMELEKNSKIAICAETIHSEYRDSMEYCGTQLVFCDSSIPKSDQWNVYHELKLVLTTRYNIPANQIAFIHDYKTKRQREKLFDAVNNGQIRVIIGSTTKMGTGTNVQKRVIAMHNLDIPWRPSDMEQRTGRGARQGNLMAMKHKDGKVMNYIYAVERTLDAYQFNLLANKQKFIDQIKDNSIKTRRIDEGAITGDGDDQQINFAEYVAMLSGNQQLLQKVKLDKKIKDLESKYDAFTLQKSSAKSEVKNRKYTIQQSIANIKRFESDFDNRTQFELEPNAINRPKKRYYYPKPVIIDNKANYDTPIIGKLLHDQIMNINKNHKDATLHIPDTVIATYGDFKLVLRYSTRIYIQTPSGLNYFYGHGSLPNDPTYAGLYLKHCLDNLDSYIINAERDIKKAKEGLEYYESIKTNEFPQLEELKTLKAKRKSIIKSIEDSSIKTSDESTQESTENLNAE